MHRSISPAQTNTRNKVLETFGIEARSALTLKQTLTPIFSSTTKIAHSKFVFHYRNMNFPVVRTRTSVDVDSTTLKERFWILQMYVHIILTVPLLIYLMYLFLISPARSSTVSSFSRNAPDVLRLFG